MTREAGDAYEFYPCLVDDAPASIFVNLRFESDGPPSNADTRYWVAIQMREAGPHGIGTEAEADALNAVEEALITQLAELGTIYVGRIRNRGTWEITFYGPAGHVDALRAAAQERLGSRRLDIGSQPDPAWSYYRELLLPDDERRQWMEDRRLVQVLREYGDTPSTPRRVDHWAYFSSAQARDAFVERAAREGFVLETASHEEASERPFGAHVFRVDPVELDHIHEVVMTLVDAAVAHGGSYDGWETSIERG